MSVIGWKVIELLRHKAFYGIMVLVLFCILPLAVGVVLLIVPDCGYMEQQTAPQALVLVLLFALCFSVLKEKESKSTNYVQIIGLILVGAVIFGSVYQVQIDQEAMREGKMAADTIAQSVLGDIVEIESYNEKTYAIVGNVCSNPLFYRSSIYDMAGGYAQVAGPYWNSELDISTWKGIYQYTLGVQLPWCSKEQYKDILNSPELDSIPCYPNKGYIREVNGIVVVRIS